jgi:cytochrome d ubiquinol oxidase subunit I
MNNLLYARTLMGMSLGFHIIFAYLGIGIPFLISLFELLGIITKNNNYSIVAKRFSYALIILFAVGAASGTLVAFELSLLWPPFMSLISKVDILPFALEGIAFVIEAIFLGIYIYKWDKFKNQITHWLTSIPIVIASAFSGLLITTVNAFMNTPAGFKIINGHITDIHPIKALMNPISGAEVSHVLITAYLSTFFTIAAIYAFYILKGKKEQYYKNILNVCMILVLITAILTGFTGDLQGKAVAKFNPEKLAATEGVFHTHTGVSERVGGIFSNNHLLYAIKVPDLLSFLAYGNPNAKVLGLLSFPKSSWPPFFVHYAFDAMVILGTMYGMYSLLYVMMLFIKKKVPILYHKLNLYILILLGMSSFVAVELGWISAEVGRYPWIIYHVMRIKDAITSSAYVPFVFYLFLFTFLFLFIMMIFLLTQFFKRRPIYRDGKIT